MTGNISVFDFSMIFKKNDFPYPNVVDMTAFEISGRIFIIFSVAMYLFSTKIFFRKLAFIKSVISLVVLWFTFYCIMILLSIAFYPSVNFFTIHYDVYNVTSSLKNFEVFTYAIAGISWMFFLPLGYFKLKEKQV